MSYHENHIHYILIGGVFVCTALIWFGIHGHNFKGKTDIPLISPAYADNVQNSTTQNTQSDLTKQDATLPTQNTALNWQYNWGDFMNDPGCYKLHSYLSNSPDPKNQEITILSRALCRPGPNIWVELKQQFMQKKKELIIDDILSNNSIYTKYLKVIPYVLFDIYNSDDYSQNLFGKLNAIQKNIDLRNIQQLTMLMAQLTPQQKNMLRPLPDTINQLSKMQELLNNRNTQN